MTMCAAGREVPGHGIVTQKLVIEGKWGEAWEADHETLGKVLFVAYATEIGARMFAECQRALERWNDAAQSSVSLLKILKVDSEAAVPYTLIEHPGMPNLAVRMANTEKIIDPEYCVKYGIELSEAIALVVGMNLGPLGICPQTLFYGGTPEKPKLRVMPIAPTSRLQRLLGDGRFIPAEVDSAPSLEIIHSDTYSLVWIVTEMLAGGRVDRSAEALKAGVPIDRVATDLAAVCLPGAGAYMDVNTVEMLLKRYLRSDEVAKDFARLRKLAEKQAKKGGAGKPKAAKAPGRSATPGKAGAAAGALLLLFIKLAAVGGGIVAGYYGVRWLVTTEDSESSPAGTSRLFARALLIDQDLVEAQRYTAGDGAEDARQFFDLIQGLEREGIIGRVAQAMPVIERTESSLFYANSEVVDNRGTTIFIIQMEIYPQGGNRYAVTSLEWAGTSDRTLGY